MKDQEIDIVERLRDATIDIETREPLFSGVFGHATVEELKEAAAEIERLRKKCDDQAMILRRLTPDKFPDTIFISGVLGTKDQNGMPEKLLVVPSYGVDFAYIYKRTDKTTGPEW